MSLVENIRKDMFEGTKVGNVQKVDILKLVLADIKNEEISLGEKLSDDQVLKVLRKEKKKVEDSISEYTKMNREDLVAKETFQLEILNEYLPAQMSEEDIKKIVSRVVKENNVSDVREMGRVMGIVMKELNGQADGNVVRNIVQNTLS
ncbi:MAG: hypothetical protein UR34_C0001G0053 [candidate division WS6 bacterium GW2011_GWC1_33_20]|uniref:Uncharacterized protein n=2 Tax=Candidatus Dojkabacteria TaxID=74243 RepID=A0A0G0ADT3_9BACT|nr:MAG: hypothetical protein UR32_C0007G0014 [candidate division WS6 bacterium GW2011_GWE2_33_157]KKP44707.1 MAG: hypothetical protein UR34_C0001G0053 [candidate division WS6 bacterium GW2011_GWC1_33_20]KKP45637.1 MAG: hypothetical protein UR36_C0006G0007 [candidate division WS6 bacterium GW2011_GWF1_33_233]KKP54803.1 MAG: hypothetical protein UR47_C0010G0019 [candidate division WS6 bacterium GW2011_GWB1_33_6]KKP54994.1 MAG: hypothetical protein UR45_C0006G0008 [candidate division WS6 bacterium